MSGCYIAVTPLCIHGFCNEIKKPSRYRERALMLDRVNGKVKSQLMEELKFMTRLPDQLKIMQNFYFVDFVIIYMYIKVYTFKKLFQKMVSIDVKI